MIQLLSNLVSNETALSQQNLNLGVGGTTNVQFKPHENSAKLELSQMMPGYLVLSHELLEVISTYKMIHIILLQIHTSKIKWIDSNTKIV